MTDLWRLECFFPTSGDILFSPAYDGVRLYFAINYKVNVQIINCKYKKLPD